MQKPREEEVKGKTQPESFLFILRKLGPWLTRSGFAVADQGVISGSNFLISILLARWMQSEHYGAYALAYSIFILLSLLYLTMILEPMSVFGGSTYRNNLRGYVRALLWIHLALTAIIFVGLGLSASMTALMKQSGGLPGALLGVTLAAPCVLLFWLVRRTFYLELSPSGAASGALLYLVIVLGGLYVVNWMGQLSPLTAFLPLAVGALMTCALLGYRLFPMLSTSKAVILTREVWKRHWGYGRWALASAIASWVPAYIYYPLLSSFSGMARSGEFKALMNLVAPLQQTQAALTMLFLPYAARVHGEEGRSGAGTLAVRITLLSVAGALAYWSFVIPFREAVFHLLYSGKYMEVAYLVPTVAIGSILWSGAIGFSIVLRAMEFPASVFVAFIVSSVISLAVGLPATRTYGLVGAVWGTNLADAGALLMIVILLRRKVVGSAKLVEAEG